MMNYLKHSLFDIAKLIAYHRAKGDIYDIYIRKQKNTPINLKARNIITIYQKDDVSIYIVDEWCENDYDSYSYLFAKGLSDEDKERIENGAMRILKTYR